MLYAEENYIFRVTPHYKKLILDCIEKLYALNVPISKSITFKMNTGFSRFGFCKRTPNRETKFAIAINKWFEDDIAIVETIMHELVHTIDGCYNHGNKFRIYAERINETYGLRISVVGNYKLNDKAYKNKGSKRKVFNEEDYNPATMVLMMCPSCGRTFAIKKNAVRFGSRWVCRKCNRRLIYV